MKTKQFLGTAALAAMFCLGAGNLMAQNNNNGGGRNRGNFDPAQFQQRMMDNVKERLEVSDDNEWKALQPLVQKVMDSRIAGIGGMGRGMFGGRNRGGGGGGNNNGDQNAGRRFGPPPSPEAETLTKAIEAKASNSELKAALAKYVESRKAKQAELEKAQADLRKVLSLRQEAIATEMGLL